MKLQAPVLLALLLTFAASFSLASEPGPPGEQVQQKQAGPEEQALPKGGEAGEQDPPKGQNNGVHILEDAPVAQAAAIVLLLSVLCASLYQGLKKVFELFGLSDDLPAWAHRFGVSAVTLSGCLVAMKSQDIGLDDPEAMLAVLAPFLAMLGHAGVKSKTGGAAMVLLLVLPLSLSGCVTTGTTSASFHVPRAGGCVELQDDGQTLVADAEFVGVVEIDGSQLLEFALQVGPAVVNLADAAAKIPASIRLSGLGFLNIDGALECLATKGPDSKPRLRCLPASPPPTTDDGQPLEDGSSMGPAPLEVAPNDLP